MTSKINGSDNFDTDPLSKLDWDGVPYVDPDAIGANPVAKIYPDGSIVGSTDNGSYTKWPNGNLEVRENGVLVTTTNIGNGNIFSANGETFVYPVLFVSIPSVSLTPIRTSAVVWACMESSSTSSVQGRLMGSTNVSQGTITMTATGRWK